MQNIQMKNIHSKMFKTIKFRFKIHFNKNNKLINNKIWILKKTKNKMLVLIVINK